MNVCFLQMQSKIIHTFRERCCFQKTEQKYLRSAQIQGEKTSRQRQASQENDIRRGVSRNKDRKLERQILSACICITSTLLMNFMMQPWCSVYHCLYTFFTKTVMNCKEWSNLDMQVYARCLKLLVACFKRQQNCGTSISTVSSQQEGPWFKSQLEFFLCEVCTNASSWYSSFLQHCKNLHINKRL